MKKRFVVILLLFAFLGYTVYKMMMYEKSIREDHIITKYVEDETKPLIETLNNDDLQQIVNDINPDFKAGYNYFLIRKTNDENTKFKPVFLKGVNLGVAVPGHFPAEFSMTFDQYLDWFKMIGKMNSNVIRVYTILPPDFYKALAYYNLKYSNKKLYLLHGIWATIPNKHYYEKEYMRSFKKEIIDVVDVLHGNAVLKPKPGKANGVYATDISGYVIGYLLGREWEPHAVFNTIKKVKEKSFNGNFISLPQGNAMEVWLAKMMDFTMQYETQKYQEQRPVSFVNWLPLDPMYHNTEFIENKKVKEYDNDLVSVDFSKFNPGILNKAGIFAAYHVYPYYPDFIYLEKNYANTINHLKKKDNYLGYLIDLKQYTPGMPLVIAEYGLPTSRGVSHFTPSGFNQGGHSFVRQAELSLTLTKDIYEADLAGAIYFEWADEWFKHNWLVMDFEIPFEDRKNWHNMENPEQNFGIIALEDKKKNIDAKLDDWNVTKKIHKEKNIIYADADATYFYTAAKFKDFDFDKHNLYIAIDTYDKEKGDHKLPFSTKIFDRGFEFLVKIKDTSKAKILVDEPYSVFTDIYNDYIPVYASKNNKNGKFIDQFMLVNRGRETLTGKKTDSIINNRSPLIYGLSNNPKTSNADWLWNKDTKTFELRLDWHLINVSDPSQKYVLDDKKGTQQIEASQTKGFYIYYFITDKNNNLIEQIPNDKPMFFTWKNWKKPNYTQAVKPIFDTLKNYFNKLKTKDIQIKKNTKEKFEIAEFYGDKHGAISISFNDMSFSQYEYAYPLLNKYLIKANYSIIPDLINNLPGKINIDNTDFKAMGLIQIKEILSKKNEVALQAETNKINSNDLFMPKLNKEIKTAYISTNTKTYNLPKRIFVRKKQDNKDFSCNGVSFSVLKTNRTTHSLDSILKSRKNKWTIISYYHIFKDSAKLPHIDKEILKQKFINFEMFRRQIRLARNTDYWIDTENNVYKYLYVKNHSKIEVNKVDDFIFIRLKNKLNPNDFNSKMTIKYYTNSKKIKISGSASDGIYLNKTGVIVFDVLPNKTVKLQIIE